MGICDRPLRHDLPRLLRQLLLQLCLQLELGRVVPLVVADRDERPEGAP